MGRFTAYYQDGRVADFDKSDYDFLCRYGRTPEEVMEENAKLRKLIEDLKVAPCCGSECWMKLEDRMREVGVEVDS